MPGKTYVCTANTSSREMASPAAFAFCSWVDLLHTKTPKSTKPMWNYASELNLEQDSKGKTTTRKISIYSKRENVFLNPWYRMSTASSLSTCWAKSNMFTMFTVVTLKVDQFQFSSRQYKTCHGSLDSSKYKITSLPCISNWLTFSIHAEMVWKLMAALHN